MFPLLLLGVLSALLATVDSIEIRACYYTDFIPVSYQNRTTGAPSGYGAY